MLLRFCWILKSTMYCKTILRACWILDVFQNFSSKCRFYFQRLVKLPNRMARVSDLINIIVLNIDDHHHDHHKGSLHHEHHKGSLHHNHYHEQDDDYEHAGKTLWNWEEAGPKQARAPKPDLRPEYDLTENSWSLQIVIGIVVIIIAIIIFSSPSSSYYFETPSSISSWSWLSSSWPSSLSMMVHHQ